MHMSNDNTNNHHHHPYRLQHCCGWCCHHINHILLLLHHYHHHHHMTQLSSASNDVYHLIFQRFCQLFFSSFSSPCPILIPFFIDRPLSFSSSSPLPSSYPLLPLFSAPLLFFVSSSARLLLVFSCSPLPPLLILSSCLLLFGLCFFYVHLCWSTCVHQLLCCRGFMVGLP